MSSTRIGIISDTHGDAAAWRRATDCLGPVDLMIHAGDVLYHGPRNPLPAGYDPAELINLLTACPYPVLIAQGNCDAAVDAFVLPVPLQSPVVFLQWEGIRILAHHGHQYPPDQLLSLAERWGARLCISGHTHVAGLERRNGIICLNPGSPSLPMGTAARPTVARLADHRVELLDVATGEVLVVETL
ncbi:MAG: phosphodiesterase [Moorellales bacterium]